jgi:sulfatase maturation enzyme AslB (radical SAM superfamily)
MRTLFFVSILLPILVLPFFTIGQSPAATEIPQTVTVEEVRQFMNEYKNRYMEMNLDAFMDLFSKEAVENRMIPYADFREVYRKTFANSNAIQYNLEIYSIQTHQKGAFVSGRYELIQSLKGSNEKRVLRGNIQWGIVREDGLLKIKEINYGRDR